MPRPPIPTYDGPDRKLPPGIRERVEHYRDQHIAQLDAHQELLGAILASFGHARIPIELLNSIAVLRVGADTLAFQAEREGEHARGLRDTVRNEPPDPDRAPAAPIREPERAQRPRRERGPNAPWDDETTPVANPRKR